MATARTLRPKGADDLGLRRALSGRLLPLLVAAMVFLAALAGAGGIAAAGLVRNWRGGAAQATTIQVPDPDARLGGITRADAVAARLGPGARRVSDRDLFNLLQPWLGEDAKHLVLTMPAVFTVAGRLPKDLASRLEDAAPGTLVSQDSLWQGRLAALSASLQACADLALAVVVFVATAVVAVSTRAGLAARRDAIEIVHGLGATDATIAGRFAARVTLLVLAGAILGGLLAVPMLLGLARLAAPFQPDAALTQAPATASDALASLSPSLWGLLACLPLLAAAIGWLTAQVTVRNWLAQLP